MSAPYILPPAVDAARGTPPAVPSGEVWLFDGAKSWSDPHYAIKIANANPGQQYNFVGTSMENKADWVAYNLPAGVVLTLLTNPTTPPAGQPFSFAGAGVCVDLFGNGQTQTVDLAKVSAVNCLSAFIWRTPDLATGVFQLFDAKFAIDQEPSSSTTGPRNTFFLSEWGMNTTQTLVGWAISDASDAIWFAGLNAASVVLYDGGNGDGAMTGAFSGWFEQTWEVLQTQNFTNRAASWSWSLLTPVSSSVDPVTLNVPASATSMTSLTQQSTGVNSGGATVQQQTNFQINNSQTLTTTTTYTVATANEISETMSFGFEAGIPGDKTTQSFSIGIKFTETDTKSTSTTNTTTQTYSISETLTVTVPPNHTWTADWTIQLGQVPATSFKTTGHYYYDRPIPGSVYDEAMTATLGLGKPIYRLDATVTGVVKGSLAAQSTTNVATKPIGAA